MPLTKLQKAIARLVAPNRTPKSHLAGGAAIHLATDALRISNDLDYFHDEEGLVAEAFNRDLLTLHAAGYSTDVVLQQPGFVRVIVGKGNESTKVEWAHDSAWRFFPPVKHRMVGYHLHPLDLAINKVLALAGRDEPRDFLDAIFVHRKYLSIGALCWAAAGKDPGYTPELLVEMLARKGKYRADDFEPLQLVRPPNLMKLKQTWLSAIDEARQLVRALPPEDVGCLYLDPSTGRYVTPTGNVNHLLKHRGARGGVIARVGETPALARDSSSRRLFARKYPPPSGKVDI